MMPFYLQDFARRYTSAWCSQNAASVSAFFSENGSLAVNDGAPAVGRAAIQAVAQSFMTAFPDLCVVLIEVVPKHEGDGNLADYHWSLIGTNTGPGGTGNRVHINGVEHWQFGADNLIAVSRGEFNLAEYQRQIGAT